MAEVFSSRSINNAHETKSRRRRAVHECSCGTTKPGLEIFDFHFAIPMADDGRRENPHHFVEEALPRKNDLYFLRRPLAFDGMDRPNRVLDTICSSQRKGREIVRANEQFAGPLKLFKIERSRDMPRAVFPQRMERRGIPHRVAVDFGFCRKSRVEVARSLLDFHHTDRIGQVCVQRQKPLLQGKSAGWHIRVGTLRIGMHTGIRAARSMNDDAVRAEGREGFFEVILDCIATHLALPAVETAAMIGDFQPQPHPCESSQL